MRGLASIVALIALTIAGSASAQLGCLSPSDQVAAIGDYYDPAGDVVRAKIIFVAFPQDGLSSTIDYDYHGQFMAMLDNYISMMSRGRLQLAQESTIILPLGEVFDAAHPVATTWQADLPGATYRDPASLPPDYEYSFLSTWWAGTGTADVVSAEILYKVWDAYKNSGVDLFPDTGDGAARWQILMVFLTNQSPYAPPAGGMPDIHVNRFRVAEDTNGFFNNVAASPQGFTFKGTGQVSLASGIDPGVLHPNSYFRPFIHEFMHTLGLRDGPPDLRYVQAAEEKYFYGNLNIVGSSGFRVGNIRFS